MSTSKHASDWVDPDAEDETLLPGERGEGQPRDRLRDRTPCRDWPWIIVWLVQFIVVLAIGYSCFSRYREEMTSAPAEAVSKRGDTLQFNKDAFGLLAVLVAVSLGLALSYLLVVRAFAERLIWASLITLTALLVLFLVYFCVVVNVLGIVLMALCIPLHCWYIWAIRDRIPFSTNVLTTVVKILDLWPSTIALALSGLVLQAIWFVVWLIAAISIFYSMNVEFERGKPVSTSDKNPLQRAITVKFVFALFGLLISYFWSYQIIRNVVHVTVSGVLATWYFLFPNSMPEGSPVWAAFRRATTSSFGSVVLASLVNAVVNAIRWTFQLVARWMMSEETSCLTVACVCITECLVRMLEQIVQYVNSYALSYVAIYGKSYFTSAKAVYHLMDRRGLDAVINDDLINGVLWLGALLSGVVCAVLSALLGTYVFRAGGDWKTWALIGLLLGFCLTLTVMSVVESAVVTLFVCLADDPAVLRSTKRPIYDLLVPDMCAQYEGVDLDVVNPNSARSGDSSARRADQRV